MLRLIAAAVFWVTAIYIVWRKPKEWMVLYLSATLLMMSYLFAFQLDQCEDILSYYDNDIRQYG